MLIKDLIDSARFSLNMVPKEDVPKLLLPEREKMIAQLPAEGRYRVRNLVDSMDNLRTVADLPTFFSNARSLSREMETIANTYGPDEIGSELHQKISYIAGVDSMGYRPAGARAFKYFINPFAVYSFYAENHWATKGILEKECNEVKKDGYSLIHGRDVSPERRAYVENVLDYLNIGQLRVSLLRHYKVYGNALILPHYTPFKTIKRLEVMVMDRMMPVWDKTFETIIAWDHWQGYISTVYDKKDLLHLKTSSLKMPDLGVPPLSPMVVDIESDLAASALNSTVMHKAGMISLLIALDDTKDGGNPGNSRDSTRIAKRLQREIAFSYSGLKGGQSILVSNYVKDVHKLSQIGEFDGNFMKLRIEIAKGVCVCLNMPSEKIGVSRSTALQYIPSLIEDTVNADFNNAIAADMTDVDGFINKKILKGLLGIYDIEIEANARYGSLTMNGAKASLMTSQAGIQMTENEHLRLFYGLPARAPWDKRGFMIIDNSKNRDMACKPPKYSKFDYTDNLPSGKEVDDERDMPQAKTPQETYDEQDIQEANQQDNNLDQGE